MKKKTKIDLIKKQQYVEIEAQNEELKVAKEKAEENEEKLIKLNNDLIQSNKELEQFAYVASHDLQEPLRMISSYVQLLERRYKDQLDDNAKEYINYAVDGAKRMQMLINDLLSYSRINSKKLLLFKTDTTRILGQAIVNLQMKIVECGALIINDNLPDIVVDESQMVLLFQNLLSNSMKFCQTVPHIHISAKKQENFWIFAIKDNGIGIEIQYHNKIFAIFQRLHPQSEFPGTGIGLSICKKIVEKHGGEIWIESEPNIGTVFYFSIPQNISELKEKNNFQTQNINKK